MNVSLICAVNTHERRASSREIAVSGQFKRAMGAVVLNLHGSKNLFADDLRIL
jgi:hypothetical protein